LPERRAGAPRAPAAGGGRVRRSAAARLRRHGTTRQPRLPTAARARAARAAGDDPPYLSPRAAARRRRRALPLRAKAVRRGAPAAVRRGARRRGTPPSPPLEPARHPDDRTPRSGGSRRARLYAGEPLPGRDPGPRRPALRPPGRLFSPRAGSPRSGVLHRLRGPRHGPPCGSLPDASPDRVGGRRAGRRAALPRRRRGPRASLAARATADDGGGRPVPPRGRLAGAQAGGARGGGARAVAVGPEPRCGALRCRGVGQPVRLQHGARHRARTRARAGPAVHRVGKGRAVGPGPTARAARGRARARTRTARRTDARLRGARAARLSAVAGRARPRRGVAHGGTPGRDARRDGSRARGGRRAGALGRIGALTGSIPDLARVRDFLRQWCDAEVAVDGVRYKPERKWVLRYDLTWAGGAAPSRPAVVYAKVARRAKFERTQHILGRIRAADDGLGFELPEPLGTLPELCMEFFSHLPGVPLSTLVAADAFPRLCERAAASLLHFHTVPVALGWERGVAANVAKVT